MFLPFKAIRNKKGFTLVELIVVMAVLAIISAIAVPRFLGVQKQAKLDADYATGAMIAKAAELYEAKVEGVPATITANVLDDAGYINGIEFKSEDFSTFSASTINIKFGNGDVSVFAGLEEATEKQLYPRPATEEETES